MENLYSVSSMPDMYGRLQSYISLDDMSWPCGYQTPSPISPTTHESFNSSPVDRSFPYPIPHSSLQPRLSVPDERFSDSRLPQRPKKPNHERRKAQNRASQRAYRDRKESQIKDLSTSLEACQELIAAMKIENGELEAHLAKAKTRVDSLRSENECLRARLPSASDCRGSLGTIPRSHDTDFIESGMITPDDSADCSRGSSVLSLCSPAPREGYKLDSSVDWTMFREGWEEMQNALGTGLVKGCGLLGTKER